MNNLLKPSSVLSRQASKKMVGATQSGHINRQSGFTLVEIMVVVVILAVFASAVAISAGNSESRKNQAYYEYLLNSMDYIRLTSAERMQPMGIRLISNEQGQRIPQVVRLDNAYSHYQQSSASEPEKMTDRKKNNMELSAQVRNSEQDTPQPVWTVHDAISLPEPPQNITIDIKPVSQQPTQEVQPWFNNQESPVVVWYGTGQASNAHIEIKSQGRLVGDIIQILPDGSTKSGL